MKRDEFEHLIAEIGRGADVDQEELVDVLGYAKPCGRKTSGCGSD